MKLPRCKDIQELSKITLSTAILKSSSYSKPLENNLARISKI
jgi:phage FluMu protein Com